MFSRSDCEHRLIGPSRYRQVQYAQLQLSAIGHGWQCSRPSARIIEHVATLIHGGWHGNDSGCRRRDANLGSLQGRSQQPGSAQPAGRNVPAAGEIQRRADLVAAARRRRARRPDLGRRVRPDGRHRRLRPVARRQVRDLLRAAYPRRHARRAADDGLGAAAGPLEGQQAQRGHQDARSQAGPPADRNRAFRADGDHASPSWKR